MRCLKELTSPKELILGEFESSLAGIGVRQVIDRINWGVVREPLGTQFHLRPCGAQVGYLSLLLMCVL